MNSVNPTISFTDAPQPEQASISLTNTGENAYTSLPDPVKSQRAVKGAIASGQNVNDISTLYSSPDGEQVFRDQMSNQKAIQDTQAKVALTDHLIKDGPMTDSKANSIVQLANPSNTLQDPNATEDLYAKNVIKYGFANATSPVYTAGITENPEKVHSAQDVGAGLRKPRCEQ